MAAKIIKALMITILLFGLAGFSLANQTQGLNDVPVVMFYGDGCPHCAKAHEFFAEITDKYPTMDFKDYEVYSDQYNRDLFARYTSSVGQSMRGVPTIFVGKKVFVGFSNQIGEDIEKQIQLCLTTECSGFEDISNQDDLNSTNSSVQPDFENKDRLEIIGWFGILAVIIVIVVFALILMKPEKKHKKNHHNHKGDRK